jgi:hypothetical protein
MKPGISRASWILAAIILGAGLAYDFTRQSQSASLVERGEKLEAKAKSLGISIEQGRSRPRDRAAASGSLDAGETRDIKARLIDMIVADEDEEKILDLMTRLLAMSPDAIGGLIEDLRKEAGLSEEQKREATSMLLFAMAGTNPEQAATMAHELRDFLKEDFMGDHVLQLSLASWAANEPDAALDWFRQRMQGDAKAFDDETKSALLGGIAGSDPARAFLELKHLKLEGEADAISNIMSSAIGNPETRDQAVTALRNAIAASDDEEQREALLDNGWLAVGETLQGEGYAKATEWMESMNLTKEELASLAGGLGYYGTAAETGQWITWIETNLTPEDADSPVRELMGEWTEQDYLAAGNWLATAPEGQAKQAAVVSYVEAVSTYEPQIAEQWALTLPVGEQRDEALGVIRENWPDSDPDGAKAFAARHGME